MFFMLIDVSSIFWKFIFLFLNSLIISSLAKVEVKETNFISFSFVKLLESNLSLFVNSIDLYLWYPVDNKRIKEVLEI